MPGSGVPSALSGRVPEGTGARERLLDASGALIIERQSIDISLADIAAKAGLNSALVKYYFGSKTGLLVALLQRDATRALAAMDELLGLNVSAGQKMRLHLRGIMNTYKRSPYLNRLLHALLHGPDEEVRQENPSAAGAAGVRLPAPHFGGGRGQRRIPTSGSAHFSTWPRLGLAISSCRRRGC
ncbi:MAG: TetR/AcrR family transcriptional regulator [Rhodospirillales bacterium]